MVSDLAGSWTVEPVLLFQIKFASPVKTPPLLNWIAVEGAPGVPPPPPEMLESAGAAAVSVAVIDCDAPEIVIPVTVKVTGPFPPDAGMHPAAQETVKLQVLPPGDSCVLSARRIVKLPAVLKPVG